MTRLIQETLGSGTKLLRQFALPDETDLLLGIKAVECCSAFRHMTTPSGFKMSVALTNCGTLGWVSDRSGYRYDPCDPETGTLWPSIPESFIRLADEASISAGFGGFVPDVCLINRYIPGARLSLHQDKDERDFNYPIISVSLGMTATFLLGGAKRSSPTTKIELHHGDVLVWGGSDRLQYHGVSPLKSDPSPILGNQRINLTFRKAS